MDIKTSARFEELPDNKGRIWIEVTVDGDTHRYVQASGPRDDVKSYYEGEITLDQLKTRWRLLKL